MGKATVPGKMRSVKAVRKCTPPPDKVLRVVALVKKPPEARSTPQWKQECEELMAVADLHGAAEFWLLRSQYAELMRSKSEAAIKAVTTPIVLGLEAGAQPHDILRSRALRLVNKLYGDWKTVKHAREMAGALQIALRKTF